LVKRDRKIGHKSVNYIHDFDYDVNIAHSLSVAEQATICQVNTKKEKFYEQEEICSLSAENVEHTVTHKVLSVSVAARSFRKYAVTADLKQNRSMHFIAPIAAKSFTHDL
jgi:hypothetical protein